MYTGVELAVRVVLAHFVADYLLQPKSMAIQKSDNTCEGWSAAVVHCYIYTATMMAFVGIGDLILAGWILLSHFIIDKFSLTTYWMKMIKGRDLSYYVNKGNDLRITFDNHIGSIFACIVYVVADATLHFLLLGAIFKWKS